MLSCRCGVLPSVECTAISSAEDLLLSWQAQTTKACGNSADAAIDRFCKLA